MNVSPPGDPPSSSEPLTVPPVPCWRWWIHLVLLAGYVLAMGLIGLNRTGHQAPLSRFSPVYTYWPKV